MSIMTPVANIQRYNKNAGTLKERLAAEQSPIPPKGKYLGKDANGYTYRTWEARGEHYVYQYDPHNHFVGYVCGLGAWERTYNSILIVEKP